MKQKRILPVALGSEPAELVLKNVETLNVFTGEFLTGDIAIAGGRVAGVGRYHGKAEIDCAGKTARRLRERDYGEYDLLIGMDRENLHGMRRICCGDPAGKLHLLMDFTGRPGEVADPWYTGDFEATWRDVEEGCRGLLDWLRERGMLS